MTLLRTVRSRDVHCITAWALSAMLLTAATGAFALMCLAPSKADPDAFAYNRILGRDINLGNALDAPSEGAWGVRLKSTPSETPLSIPCGYRSPGPCGYRSPGLLTLSKAHP